MVSSIENLAENEFQNHFGSHIRVVQDSLSSLEAPVVRASQLISGRLREGRKLVLFGNGGSAADAQHIATELTVRLKKDRKPIAAVALTTDSSALTAIGNDFGFEYIFSRQLQAIGNSGDIALGFSTSGNSMNVIKAIEVAKKSEMVCIGMTGGDGGVLGNNSLLDCEIRVPSQQTAHIQEVHIMIGHVLCAIVEKELGYV